MDAKILEIKNIKKKYPSGFELDIENLDLSEGKIEVLIGPNGSGKSTLIKLINLLEKPDSGQIIFEGVNILADKTDANLQRSKMSVVFQEPLLFNMSVYNNIILGLKLRKIPLVQKKDFLDFLVKKLKLENMLARNPKSLSGGEQQRVALVRALVLEPVLLLLDEPLANIDQLSRDELRGDFFEILRSMGRATVYVTHDRTEAMMAADNIAILNNGKIEQAGPKTEVFQRPVNEFVARFVGVETLVEGMVQDCQNNVCRVRINGIDIYSAANAPVSNMVTLAIRPENVILYPEDAAPETSSALNNFSGVISMIQDMGVFKRVEINCGFNLSAFVTQNSIERMQLEVGKKIKAAVKASSVLLFKK